MGTTKITKFKIALTTDASGDATGYSKSVRGRLLRLFVDYNGADATTDLTITEEETSTTLYSNTDTNTDFSVYPRTAVQDNAGTDVTYDGTNEIYEPFVVFGRIKAVVAQGGASKSITIYAYIEEF